MPRYKYPDGSFPISHPVFQGLVSIAGVPVQAYPLSRVQAARRGGVYYISESALRHSPLAPGTGLKVPLPNLTFKSHLSREQYLEYVSPVTGVPI